MIPGIKLFDAEKPTLEEVQKIVGGWVELVTLPDGNQLLVDEEGLLKGKRVNEAASLLAGKIIVGEAVILTKTARWS